MPAGVRFLATGIVSLTAFVSLGAALLVIARIAFLRRDMERLSILFTDRNKAELVDEPKPVAAHGEVVVRLVRSCISSGTERANLTGVPDGATGIFGDENDTRVTWPRRGGYSSSGVVESTGEGVTSVKPGDRVAMSWSWHKQYMRLPENQVYRLPGNVSFQDAAFAHISTFPSAAIRKCRLEFGESAIVMGQGVLGQLSVGINGDTPQKSLVLRQKSLSACILGVNMRQ